MISSIIKKISSYRIIRHGKGASYTESLHEQVSFDLKDCISINGFSFSNDWHFLVSSLKQYENNSELKYEDTFLCKYYEHYQPGNLEEVLFGKKKNSNESVFNNYRDPQNAPMPWTPMRLLPDKYLTYRSDYGPKEKDSSYGQERFNRLKKIYDSIKKDGYDYNLNLNGANQIKGIILKNHSQYKILVFNGNHRVAVLSALGYKKIQFRFVNNYPTIVDIENVENWPCVSTGIYSKEDAERLFLHYFTETGVNKAEEWEIIS